MGEIVYIDSTRNSEQFAPYFRADLKINFKVNAKKVTHEIGLDLVSSHNPDFLTLMRRQARRICLEQGMVTCDELREYASAQGIEPKHPNAWGAVFRTGFRKVGYQPSRTPSAHARIIAQWAL